MTTFKTNKFGAKRGDFDYLYGEYNSLEEAKKALKWTAVVGQQFAVINEENKAELYLWQGRDKEPTKVGSGGEYKLQEVIQSEIDVEGGTDAIVKNYGLFFEGTDHSLSDYYLGYVSKIAVKSELNKGKTNLAYVAIGEYENGYLSFTNSILKPDGNTSNNSYFGGYAMSSLTSENAIISDNNLAIGYTSLYRLNGGTGGNTSIGQYSGYNLTTGSNNTLLGHYAGRGIKTGSGNTILGKHASLPADTSNIIALYNGSQRLGFKVDTDGTTTIPAQTNALIDADTTGKASITKGYLTPKMLISILTSATEAEKTQIKTLLGL